MVALMVHREHLALGDRKLRIAVAAETDHQPGLEMFKDEIVASALVCLAGHTLESHLFQHRAYRLGVPVG